MVHDGKTFRNQEYSNYGNMTTRELYVDSLAFKASS